MEENQLNQPFKRRGRPKTRLAKEERIAPTPETAIKLQDDFLHKLPPELQLNAWKIDVGYRLTTGALGVKTNRFERKDRSHEDDWKPEIQATWRAYLEWAREVKRRRLNPNLTISIVCDRISPQEYSFRHGVAHERVVELLVEQLGVYGPREG